MRSDGEIGNRPFLEPKRRIPHKTVSRGEEKRVTIRYQTIFTKIPHWSPLNNGCTRHIFFIVFHFSQLSFYVLNSVGF